MVAEAADYAAKFHKLGMLAEAEKFYAAILEVQPDHFDALYLLGILRQQQGNSVEALRLSGEALKANTRSADSLRTFGAVLDTLDRHEAALTVYDKALAAKKDRCEALVSRGIALVHLGRPQEALASFDGALAINEHHLEARINRGIALMHLRRLQEALESFDSALAVEEHHTEAFVSRGVALLHLGRIQEALAAFDKAIKIQPDHPLALSNRVVALVSLGRRDEALDACDRVLAVNPRDSEALYIRANTLWSFDKLEEAIESYEQAWALNHARALSMLALYRLTIVDWTRSGELSDALSKGIAEGAFIYPFTSVVFGLHPRDQLKAATNYLRASLPNAPKPFVHSSAVRSDKLRIAYVSSDFRQHAVASAIAELFEHHDRTRFEIIGVSLCPNDGSEIRARIVKSFDRFHDVSSETDESIAKLLKDLEVHIAVDLNGPTQGSRQGVFAYRAAPIQAVYLGYPATTGADFIDYVLADGTVLPFDQQPFFTENRAPAGLLPRQRYDQARIAGNPGTKRPRIARARLGILLFQQELQAFPAGVRCLDAALGTGAGQRALALQDERPGSGQSSARSLGARRCARSADICAICRPYRGPSRPPSRSRPVSRYPSLQCAFDRLRRAVGRTARRHLHRRLVCRSGRGKHAQGRRPAGARDREPRGLRSPGAEARLRSDAAAVHPAQARGQRSTCPLFNSDRFRRHVETAYQTMWDIHRRGESPRSFRVEPNT